MRFTLIGPIFVAAFAMVSARDKIDQAPARGPFVIYALKEGKTVHGRKIQAMNGSLWLNLPNQEADCEPYDLGYASFLIEHGSLSLYSTHSKEKRQTIFVDRRPIGLSEHAYADDPTKNKQTTDLKLVCPAQGQMSFYDPKISTLIKHSDCMTEGWRIKKGKVTFEEQSLVACPSGRDDVWSVWAADELNVVEQMPQDIQGCFKFLAYAVKDDNEWECYYKNGSPAGVCDGAE